MYEFICLFNYQSSRIISYLMSFILLSLRSYYFSIIRQQLQLNQIKMNNTIQENPDTHLENYHNTQHDNNNHTNYTNYQQPFTRQLKRSNDSNVQLNQEYEANPMNNSRISKKSNINRNAMDIELSIQKVSQYTERLKNIHHFYKIRIQQQKMKNVDRNEVFMSIIEELQNNHNKKIQQIKAQICEAQDQKKEVGLVDDRMNQIKGSIDDILKKSTSLKTSNEKLQTQIQIKQKILREKEEQNQRLKKDVMEYRTQLQNFQRMKLKQNKKNRQMLQMIDNVLSNRKQK